jgi:acyl-CoA thioesterase-2
VVTAVETLVQTLDLERLEDNLFRGESPDSPLQRVFGGQVAAQALVAAVRTVPPERHVHSLHAYFLVGGDPTVPLVYEVDRVRDGRSFSTRRVVAIQHGRPIFHLSASFQIEEPGVEHQSAMPDVPDPDSLPHTRERLTPYIDQFPELTGWWARPFPIDIRYVGDPPVLSSLLGQPREPRSQVWMRADGALPDDPSLHICVLAWASDMTLLDSVRLPHAHRWDGSTGGTASLDHAMWFHRPFRADEWFLYDQESPNASGARGLGMGRIYSQDGRLICSVVQEGLIRSPR